VRCILLEGKNTLSVPLQTPQRVRRQSGKPSSLNEQSRHRRTRAIIRGLGDKTRHTADCCCVCALLAAAATVRFAPICEHGFLHGPGWLPTKSAGPFLRAARRRRALTDEVGAALRKGGGRARAVPVRGASRKGPFGSLACRGVAWRHALRPGQQADQQHGAHGTSEGGKVEN